jgi:hypothetical protein
MPGYSGTPLARKLGYRDGMRARVDGAPAEYRSWLEPLPEGVTFLRKPAEGLDLVHLFCTEAAALDVKLALYLPRIKSDAMIWVSWPKRASKVTTDVTEDVIRSLALARGLVDVKVCAVSDVWSGLKLVIRKENRSRGT